MISYILFVMAVLMEEPRSFVFPAGYTFWDKGDIIKGTITKIREVTIYGDC